MKRLIRLRGPRTMVLTIALATVIALPASAQIRFNFGGDDDERQERREHREVWHEHRGEWHPHMRCHWERDEDGEPIKVCRR